MATLPVAYGTPGLSSPESTYNDNAVQYAPLPQLVTKEFRPVIRSKIFKLASLVNYFFKYPDNP